MENISATTLFHELLADPADAPQLDALELVAHEAAHMWFGDLVGCRDWGHIWLNEGFATYLTALYIEHIGGRDEFRQALLAIQRGAVAAEDAHSRPIVREDWTDPDEMFDDHAYPGGASRLHLLAEVLGPDVFRRGVQRYVAEHAAGIVDTGDLRAALEAESGSDLDRFFEQWVTGAGYPCFELRLAGGGDPQGARRLLVTQTQGRRGWRAAFRVPVTVAWSRGGVESSRRVLVERERVALELPGEGPLDWVRFDATTSLPARFDLEQDEAMWATQLRRASDGVTRLLAAQWFAGDPAVRAAPREAGATLTLRSRQALEQAARADQLPAVRATALRALAAEPAGDGDCARLAFELSQVKDPITREAAIAALGRARRRRGGPRARGRDARRQLRRRGRRPSVRWPSAATRGSSACARRSRRACSSTSSTRPSSGSSPGSTTSPSRCASCWPPPGPSPSRSCARRRCTRWASGPIPMAPSAGCSSRR
jgi:aminopeptidase N